MIGEVVSHFRIIEELGRGGMGVVYRAEDLRLGRTVAIKFLQDALSSDPASIARFEREARAASSLNHPHICAVHDVGLRDGRPFIVMELLEGTSLHQSVAAAPLPLEQVVERGLEIADALEAAHARGLIHRDIKPANVFITTRGEAKLLDFGLATSGGGPAVSAAEASTLQPLTNPGTVLGTLAYMSPEQVRGEPLDARSDLFSLGAVLYEAATGRRPFAGNTAGTIHDAILNRAPLPACRVNSELPPRLEEILQKALEKDRSLRYQSASDLAADLLRLKRDILSDRAPGTAASGQQHGLQASARRTRRLLAIPAGVALVAAALFFWLNTPGDAIDSIAVLPFSNVSGNPDTEYLSDGLTESLINNLSQLRTLRVIARGTVFRYKGHDRDPLAIGRDLGVRAVLTGRLLQREDRLVVRTELVDVSNGAQLWGQEYNRPSDDIITLQAQLAGEISERLRLQLSKEEQRQLTKRDTDDPVAYELYLKGRYHWNSRDVRAMGVAIGYFNQAIARDPRFALAYAGLADAYNLSSFFNASPPGDVMPRARAAASRALEIDEHLAEAHISIAYVSFTYDWDWAAATRHFERARELSPSVVDAHAYYPFYLTVGRRPAEAIAAAQRVLGTDPLSFTRIHNLAVQLLLAGKYDAAIEECRRAVTLEGVAAVTYEVMANAYGAKGQYREALAAAEQANRLNPGNAMMLALVGYVRASMGQRLEGRQILAQLTALQGQRYIPPLAFALVHAGLDDRDQAFIWLERAFEERANRLAYLPFEPTWERLRSDPRFSDLVRRIGLPR